MRPPRNNQNNDPMYRMASFTKTQKSSIDALWNDLSDSTGITFPEAGSDEFKSRRKMFLKNMKKLLADATKEEEPEEVVVVSKPKKQTSSKKASSELEEADFEKPKRKVKIEVDKKKSKKKSTKKSTKESTSAKKPRATRV